jgi:hypothetical protein
MCGKLNPQTAETCSNCGARLAPAPIVGKGEPARGSTPPASGDWMSDLRVDILKNRPKTGMLPPEPEAPTDTGNWLSRLGPEERKPAPAAKAPEEDIEPGQPPDWLSRARANVQPEVGSSAKPRTGRLPLRPEEGISAGEVPTWLSKVRDQVTAANAEPLIPTPTQKPVSSPPSRSAVPPPSKAAATPPAPKKDEEPPWLKRVRNRKVTEEVSPTAPLESSPAVEPAPEMPEWLSKLRDNSPEARAATETPSFLSSPLPPAPASVSPADDALPDWLNQMAQPAPTSSHLEAPKPRPATSTDMPDWMSAMDHGPSAAPSPFDAPLSPAAGAVPDWQSGLGNATPARSSAFGANPPNLNEISSPFDQDLTYGGETGSGLLATENPPGWDFPAADIGPSFRGMPIAGAGSVSAFSAGTEPMVSPAGGSEAPEWLETARQEASNAPPSIEQVEPEPVIASGPSLQELLKEDTIPAWLQKPAEEPAAGIAPGLPANIPAGISPAGDSGIEQAELPRWLEAMRPIEAVQVSEEDERVESIGPLAGLRGVITAEPVVAMPRRPRLFAGNIDATPQQTARAELLQRMIVETEWRGPRRASARSLWEPLVRRLIALSLLVAISIPWAGTSFFSRSSADSAVGVVKNFAETISRLDPKKPALVSFDYDPSSSPELEAGARTALKQLGGHGVPIVVISTEPSGPTLGEILLAQNGQKAQLDYGYVPGGASGLRALVGAKEIPGVGAFDQFSVILVVASKPQSVRDWIEQVHAVVPNVPMLAIVSAASDALIFPYTQGSQALPPQLTGLVSGYAGADSYRAYAQKRFLPSDTPSMESNIRWEAFGIGSGTAVAVLFIGMVASLMVLGLRGTKRKKNAKR